MLELFDILSLTSGIASFQDINKGHGVCMIEDRSWGLKNYKYEKHIACYISKWATRYFKQAKNRKPANPRLHIFTKQLHKKLRGLIFKGAKQSSWGYDRIMIKMWLQVLCQLTKDWVCVSRVRPWQG